MGNECELRWDKPVGTWQEVRTSHGTVQWRHRRSSGGQGHKFDRQIRCRWICQIQSARLEVALLWQLFG